MADTAPPGGAESILRHPAVQRVLTALAVQHVTPDVVVLPEAVRTAAAAATALGVTPAEIANSIVFRAHAADGSITPLLVLTSGAHRVDTAKVAETIGVPALARARPEFVREHTGQVIGGVSPIGHPTAVPTYIDPWLRRHDVVWAAAGHPAAVYSTTYDELVAMTGATGIEVD